MCAWQRGRKSCKRNRAPLLQHSVWSVCSDSFSPPCQGTRSLFDRFSAHVPVHEIRQYSLRPLRSARRDLNFDFKRFSVFEWTEPLLTHSHFLHAASDVQTTTCKEMEDAACVAEKKPVFCFVFFFSTRALIQESCLWKWTMETKIRQV